MLDLRLNGYDPYKGADDYYFDDVVAQKKINFIEQCLTHVTGSQARQPFICSDWQRTYCYNLFGWLHKTTKLRRYRTSWVFLPRGCGKSTFAASLCLTMLCTSGHGSPECYLCGPTSEVADRVFSICIGMRENKKRLRNLLDAKESRGRIKYPRQNGLIKKISGEVASGIGQIPSFICIDELWLLEGMRGRHFFEALSTGLGKRPNEDPLMVGISTAGYDHESLARDLWNYNDLCLKKPELDPTHLPVTFAADPKADWTSEATWEKCTPTNLNKDFLRRECAKAQQMASFESDFLRQYLNIWTDQLSAYVRMSDYDLCKTEAINTKGEFCVGHYDGSSSHDLTAFAIYWPRLKYLRCWSWLPTATAHKRSLEDGVDYLKMEKHPDSNLKLTNSIRIDRDEILKTILELRKEHAIGMISYDPWDGRHGTIQDLQRQGIKMVEFGQSYANMNAPTKEIERLIATHELNVGLSPVTRFCFANLGVKELNQFVRPVKVQKNKPIDNAVAAICALGISNIAKGGGIITR